MAYVDLDKIINVTGWGGGTIYPDVPYPVLNQRIGIFNKPNARDTDSNGWFGLLGNSAAGICQQNYNFNQQIAIAVDSWVSALSTRIKSYDFSTDIDKIDGGAIKWGIFSRGTNFFNINETSKKVKDISTPDSDLSISLWSSTKKSWIVTSWGNRFLLTWGNIFPIDADNKLLSATPTWTYLWEILAVVWSHIRTIWFDSWLWWYFQSVLWTLYSINSSWVSSSVSTISLTWSGGWFHVENRIWVWYQQSNTIAYYLVQINTNSWEHTWWEWYYKSVDLTNTTTFTTTTIYDTWYFSNTIRDICWYDWTWLLFLDGTDIKRITWAWVSASLWTYLWTTNDICAKTSSLALLTDSSWNISTQSTKLNILWTDVWWDSVSSIYDNVSFLYEPTGTLSQDDSFVGILTNLTTIWETDTLTLSINSTLVETIENVLYNNWYWKTFTLPQIILGTSAVEVQLDYVNTLGNDLKLWFGITGWTYATPTSNNGMSGNQTTARTAGSDASYIDLTLST